MTPETISFPGLIERVAHRMLLVMEAPPGAHRVDEFELATAGLDLTADQVVAIWKLVYEWMSANSAPAEVNLNG